MDYYKNLIHRTKRSINAFLSSPSPPTVREHSASPSCKRPPLPLLQGLYAEDRDFMSEVKLMSSAKHTESAYKHVRVRKSFEKRYTQKRHSPRSGSTTPNSVSGQRSPVSQERKSSLASSNLASPKRPKLIRRSGRNYRVRNIITICDMIRGKSQLSARMRCLPLPPDSDSPDDSGLSSHVSPRQVLESLQKLRKDVDFALKHELPDPRTPASSTEETAHRIKQVAARSAQQWKSTM